MNDSDHVVAMEPWYLGAQNDGLFIINRPPRPSNDHPIHDRADGPTLVLPLGNMPEKQARAIIDAHNSELLASRLAKQAPDGWALVPNEPTDKMWEAWYSEAEIVPQGTVLRHVEAYQAMIAAAPSFGGSVS